MKTVEAPEGFVLLEEVGQGGMGIIYRARDLAFDREVAIKLLQPRFSHDSPQALRFVEEALITGQLQHPGIPAVHQTGRLADARPYLVMKLIRGSTLHDLMAKQSGDEPRRHVAPDHYLSIFESICQTLGYAHAHHVIHRDLKPHNIMVGNFGEVQVMDWGIAKVLPQEPAPADPSENNRNSSNIQCDVRPVVSASGSSLTLDGSVLGTPEYMSPEQATGANASLDARADVFGLGAILCCMLTGEPPWTGENPEAIRLRSATGNFGETLNRLDACGAEPDLIALVRQCLSHDRENRPVNGEAVANAVAQLRLAAAERVRIAEVERTRATEHAREQQHRRHVLLLAGAIIIAALLSGMLGTTWGLIRANAKENEALQSAYQERLAQASESEQRRTAIQKESETQAVIDFVEESIVIAARPAGIPAVPRTNVMLREVLDIALDNIAVRFVDKPLIEARICMTFGKSFEFLGDHQTALRLQKRAFDLRKDLHGDEHHDTILSLLALSNVQESLEQHQTALDGREKAYQVSKKRFGLDHHLTQMAMNNLASSYDRFNRGREALELREIVLHLIREQRGVKDPFTLLGMNNLAVGYLYSGRENDSLRLLLEAIELQFLHLGPDHHITLDTRNSLALFFEVIKQPKIAAVIYDSIYRIRQDKQGNDHPETIHAALELAMCLSTISQSDQALKLASSALPLIEKRYGFVHGETLFCQRIMAKSLMDLNRGSEALPLIDTTLKRAGSAEKHESHVIAMLALQFRHYYRLKNRQQCDLLVRDWETRNLKHRENHIELARVWALLAVSGQQKVNETEVSHAIEHIRKALKAGWKDKNLLETHSDFQALRSRADFQELLASMKPDQQKKTE